MGRAPSLFTATIVLLSFLIGGNSIAGVADEHVCEVGADYSLVVETIHKQHVVTSKF